MSFYDTPMTKLEAVNICLSALGQPGVTSLENSVLDAQIASAVVDEVSRDLQTRGWSWNIERRTLVPASDGYIYLPPNTARVDSTLDSGFNCVQRGSRLFNVTDRTFTFTKSVTVDFFVFLPFEDLSSAAKYYIAVSAARITQQRLLGSETIQKFTVADEQRAWTELMQEEADVGDYNMLWDSNSTKQILQRRFFSRLY